jgi:hypothetical protein
MKAVTLPQALDGEQSLTIQRRQELNAGVHGTQAKTIVGIQLRDGDRAGAAIAFRTALFRAHQTEVLAQITQDGCGGRDSLHGLGYPI